MKRSGAFEQALTAGVLVLLTVPALAAPPPPAPPASSMEREVRIIRVPRDGQGAAQEIVMDEAAGLLEGMPPGMPPRYVSGYGHGFSRHTWGHVGTK